MPRIRHGVIGTGIWALLLAACSGAATPPPAAPTGAPAASATESAAPAATTGWKAEPGSLHNLAFFAAASQNGFNAAVWEGVQEAVAKAGGKATIFDGKFDAGVQLNQVEDAIASGRFDGFVIVPSDPGGIASTIEQAAAAGIPTGTVLFPIGADYTTLEPQTKGIVTTVGRPPKDGAVNQANTVVEYCADRDPCNVVILIGSLTYPFDKLRYEGYQEVLGHHPNIKIVATGEGNYSRDTSLTAMQDILQASPKIDVLLSNADQHTAGAEIALASANIELSTIFVSSSGATTDAVDAVRSGRWAVVQGDYPRSMGSAAAAGVIAALDGQSYENVINEDTFYPFFPNAMITTELLKAHTEFEGEWKG